MTESHTAWHVRHRALFCLGVLLVAQWIAWQLLPDPSISWISQDVKEHLITVSKPDALTLDSSKMFGAEIPGSPITSALLTNGSGVQYVKLSIKTEGSSNASQWVLQYTSRSIPSFDDDIIHSQSVRPILVIKGNHTELTWQLPDPAVSFRILIPKDTRFTIEKLLLAGLITEDPGWHIWRQVIVIFCFALNVSLLIGWLAQYYPLLRRLCSQPAFISALMLGLHGILMIWLLPPFQGPDENRHWKRAVSLYRSDGQPGSILHRLPVILDAESPRWKAEVPFHAANLHAVPEIPRDRGENTSVSYVKHWGYPIVGIVSLLFPPVQTLNEALIFYYTCRTVSLLLLIGMVLVAWRWGLGSWTLVVFLSFPLVLQQCVVISTDTVHNLGTLLAILLFRRHQLVGSTASWVLLFLVCCLVVIAKPPIYVLLLLLPAWYLPWSKLLRPAIWIPSLLALIAMGIAGFWYLWRIVDSEGMSLGDQARKQLDYVLTGPGFVQFFHASMEYPTRFLNPASWFGPLGWLDTNLAELHRALLWVSLFAALSLDIVRWYRWIVSHGTFSLWLLVEPLIICVVHALFVWWSLALVMYLTISEYQSAGIVGMQVRYMIPVAILLLTWPVTVIPMQGTEKQYSKNLVVWANCVLLVLAVVRAMQLSKDLHVRYWN